jgi:predicted amino acid-binding ACT domain protein
MRELLSFIARGPLEDGHRHFESGDRHKVESLFEEYRASKPEATTTALVSLGIGAISAEVNDGAVCRLTGDWHQLFADHNPVVIPGRRLKGSCHRTLYTETPDSTGAIARYAGAICELNGNLLRFDGVVLPPPPGGVFPRLVIDADVDFALPPTRSAIRRAITAHTGLMDEFRVYDSNGGRPLVRRRPDTPYNGESLPIEVEQDHEVLVIIIGTDQRGMIGEVTRYFADVPANVVRIIGAATAGTFSATVKVRCDGAALERIQSTYRNRLSRWHPLCYTSVSPPSRPAAPAAITRSLELCVMDDPHELSPLFVLREAAARCGVQLANVRAGPVPGSCFGVPYYHILADLCGRADLVDRLISDRNFRTWVELTNDWYVNVGPAQSVTVTDPGSFFEPPFASIKRQAGWQYYLLFS